MTSALHKDATIGEVKEEYAKLLERVARLRKSHCRQIESYQRSLRIGYEAREKMAEELHFAYAHNC